MLSTLTPQRRRGIEYLDDASVDHRLRTRSHRDIAVSNALFGGTRALLAELDSAMSALPVRATLLDIGTGTGEATAMAERHCAKRGIQLQTMGLDFDEGLGPPPDDMPITAFVHRRCSCRLQTEAWMW